MQSFQELKHTVVERLDLLPQSTLLEVLHYVDFLIERSEQMDLQNQQGHEESSLPAPDAFVGLAGSWSFEPGELEEILEYIEHQGQTPKSPQSPGCEG
ncbi:MAG: hypothetical protein KF893_26955 [Caldilineaceae bacterium]|nr:hypothetical protein [Caldilineaceae bacterium]